MSPDDPRHGTTAGHNAGCRESCCGEAKTRYDKRRRWEALQGQSRLVPATGTRRRVRALQAIGYSFPAIGEAASISPKTVADLCYRSKRLDPETARAIAVAYELLCMTPRRGGYATRSRRAAAQKGWAPPLAWDDIDDPNEHPIIRASDGLSYIRERTWDTPDHAACPRCGVVREVRYDGRNHMCADCRMVAA